MLMLFTKKLSKLARACELQFAKVSAFFRHSVGYYSVSQKNRTAMNTIF